MLPQELRDGKGETYTEKISFKALEKVLERLAFPIWLFKGTLLQVDLCLIKCGLWTMNFEAGILTE